MHAKPALLPPFSCSRDGGYFMKLLVAKPLCDIISQALYSGSHGKNCPQYTWSCIWPLTLLSLGIQRIVLSPCVAPFIRSSPSSRYIKLILPRVRRTPRNRCGFPWKRLPIVAGPAGDEVIVRWIGIHPGDHHRPGRIAVIPGRRILSDPGGRAVDGIKMHGGSGCGQLSAKLKMDPDGGVTQLVA